MRFYRANLLARMTLRLLFCSMLLSDTVIFSYGQTKAPQSVLISDPVLIGAGDIAECGELANAEATARLLDANPGTVMALGDLAYGSGSDKQFQQCYDKTWGRHKAQTRPAVGDHEWHTENAKGYAQYWKGTGISPGRYYYSYELETWHIVVLDTNCGHVNCAAGSQEEQWLRKDLSTHPSGCTLAYFHQPRFSSGFHGNDSKLQPFWQPLYDAGVDVVVNGHDHDYERFAQQDPTGKPDPARGIREFVVGTGGKHLRGLGHPQPNSQVRNGSTFGVLKLTLHSGSYDWEFLPVTGATFRDSGSASCH